MIVLREVPTVRQSIDAARLRAQRQAYVNRETIAVAQRLLSWAGNALGMPVPRLYASLKHENAASDGIFVYVNPLWARWMLEKFCDDAACNTCVLLGVLAHELAHHHFGDAFARDQGTESGRERELRADRYAGVALAAVGCPAEHLACVIDELSGHGSATHPAGWIRAANIRYAHDSYLLNS